MDPAVSQTSATILGLSYAGKAAIDVVAGFVKDLVGPTVNEMGQAIAAPLKDFNARRVQRINRTIEGAAVHLVQSGIPCQSVPDNILIPLLQGAALTDEPALRDCWAALLANSASPGEAANILPAFANILSQLAPIQALALDWLFQMAEDGSMGFLIWPDVSREDMESHCRLTSMEFALYVSDLDRLQVVEGRRKTDVPSHLKLSSEQMQDLIVGRWDSREKYRHIALTTLGIKFMFACTAPSQVTAINARIRSRATTHR